mmetsp:Transcript_10579/g.10655  ORF Transcript_10579/g.10655 Transcript_10579/m.10655 type:complete len:124 (-) Transcript_10579:230-601(-)
MEEPVEPIAKPVKQFTRNPNDPRRDKPVFHYNKEVFAPKEGDGGAGQAEFYQLISLMIGVYAFLMKQKWASWACLFFFYTSVINMKLEGRLQQIFTGMGIIMVSFVSTYLQPVPPAQPMTPPS